MRGKPTGRAGWTVTLSYFERETPACTLGWRKLFDQGVETVDVPGDHLTCLQEPHIHIAQRLNMALKKNRNVARPHAQKSCRSRREI